MSTTTTHYVLVKPGVADPVDADLWGGELNDDMDIIDGVMFANSQWKAESESIASATTTDLGTTVSANVLVTGTTTITSFGTIAAGTVRWGRFNGALTLTYNASSLILPGAATITTAANDSFRAISLGSGNWVVTDYFRASGQPIAIALVVTSINFGDETLNKYDEGSWTPVDASGAGLSFSSVSANYTRIGRMVYAYCHLNYPVTANASAAMIGGFPFAAANADYARQGQIAYTTSATAVRCIMNANTSTAAFFNSGGSANTNAQLSNTSNFLMFIYPVS